MSPWGMLAIICFYNFTIAISFHCIPPLVSLIIDDLQLTHAQAGTIMAIFSIPGILFTIPAGFLSNRIGIKKVGIIAMLLVITGSLIIYLSHDFPWLLLGRLMVGFGGVTLPIVGLQAIAILFMGKQLGLAMGIYSSVICIATVIPLFTFGAVGVLWGWRSAILIVLIISVMAFILFAAWFKLPATATRPEDEHFSLRPLLGVGWPTWVIAISWTCFGIANVSLLTFLSDFIYRSGIELQFAGPITGIIMLSGVVLGPIVGHLVDRTKYKSLYMIVPGAVAAATTLIIPEGIRFIIVCTTMIGIATSPIGPAIFAMVPEITGKEKFALAYGVIFTFNNIGMVIGPSVAGLIRDISGSYLYTFWFIAWSYLMLGIVAIILLLREMKLGRFGRRA